MLLYGGSTVQPTSSGHQSSLSSTLAVPTINLLNTQHSDEYAPAIPIRENLDLETRKSR